MPSLSDNNVKVHISTDADTDGIDKTSKSLDNLEDSSQRTSKAASALGVAAKAGAAGVIAIGAGVVGATVSGIKFNSSVESATATINAFTKDAGKTAEIMKNVKEESLKTQFSFTDMAEATAGLIPASKQSGVALQDLIKQAEILAALNPAEGLTGGAFALKEALSGDFTSIVERFNLPRKRLNELKAEGVPAMQAIQTALKEMGIDYSLVAAQGQTTGARWDTMKDQFTQMAGAMSKPLFDQVSRSLASLSNSIDFQKWGEAGANAMVKIIDGFKKVYAATRIFFTGDFDGALLRMLGVEEDGEFIAKLFMIRDKFVELANIVTSALGPSFIALGNTVKNELLPAFMKWWDIIGPGLIPVLKVLGEVLGVTVIAAIWLVVNALNAVITVMSSVMNGLFAFRDGFINVAGTIVGAWNTLPVTIGAAAYGAAHWIQGAFEGAAQFVKTIPDRMLQSFTNLGPRIKDTIGNIDIPGPLGRVRDVVPGFATGGYTGHGSTNDVAGVVHRGEYVIPKSQVDQSTGLPKIGVNTTMTIGTVILNTKEAVQEFVSQLDADSILASKGLATRRGM